jgi:hypothetical protein
MYVPLEASFFAGLVSFRLVLVRQITAISAREPPGATEHVELEMKLGALDEHVVPCADDEPRDAATTASEGRGLLRWVAEGGDRTCNVVDSKADVMHSFAAPLDPPGQLGIRLERLEQLDEDVARVEERQPDRRVVEIFGVRHRQPEVAAEVLQRLARAAHGDAHVIEPTDQVAHDRVRSLVRRHVTSVSFGAPSRIVEAYTLARYHTR